MNNFRNCFKYLTVIAFYSLSCDKHHYGEKCDQDCSFFCADQLCDPETGHCYECLPGRIGHDCNQVCSGGFYGPQCKLTCPDGCDHRGCHYDNGFCFGCKPGRTGYLCENDCKQPRAWGIDCMYSCPKECGYPNLDDDSYGFTESP